MIPFTWQECPLGAVATSHVLYDIVGHSVRPDYVRVILIGEAPGAGEDCIGKPFVGASGKLLREVLRTVVPPGESVAIINTLACRPVGYDTVKRRKTNRLPEASELTACKPRVREVIKIFDPKVIVALGRTASEWVDLEKLSLTYKVVNAWHPSYVLRNGGAKSKQYAELKSSIRSAF